MVRTRRQYDLIWRTEWEMKRKGIKSSSSSGSVSSIKESKPKLNVVTDTEADSGFDGFKEVTSDSSDQPMLTKSFFSKGKIVHASSSSEVIHVPNSFFSKGKTLHASSSEVIHVYDSEEEEKVGSVSQDCGLKRKGNDGVSVNLDDGDSDLGSKFVLISDSEKSDSELGVGSNEEGAASDLRSGSDEDSEEVISDFEPDSISSEYDEDDDYDDEDFDAWETDKEKVEDDDSDDEDFDVCETDKEKVEKHKKKEGARMDIEGEKESKIRVRTRSVVTRTKDVGRNEIGCKEEEGESKDSDMRRNKRTVERVVQSRGAETVYDDEITSRLTRRMKKTIEKVSFWGSASKKLDIYSVMVNSIWKKDDAKDGDLDSMKEEKEKDDETHGQTVEKPKVPSLPLKFTFGIKELEPVIKSESELELDTLWDEFGFVIRSEEVGSFNTYSEVVDEKEDEPSEGKPATVCKHDFVLDEEVGIYCRFCPFILIESRDMMPDIEKLPSEVQTKRVNSPDHHNNNDDIPFDQCEADFDKPCNDNEDGTVWGLIPGTRGTMYPHQQEGFEFLWKNLAGTIDIKEMNKMAGLHVGGGCIISHAMGTGKTWLSIAFLKSYLKRFSDCRPVIMAPAGLLLTWEEEFQKWKAGIPFHNLSSKDLSGNEDGMIVSGIIGSGRQREPSVVRMAKLYSWIKKESVLGISYQLFEKLAGEDEELLNQKNSKILQQREDIKKILIEKPGLVVFDEGHTPRNHRTKLWKALTNLRTEKRIILSGTPFQNNFRELYRTLELVRPASIAGLPPVNQFGGKSYHRPSKRFKLGSTNRKNFPMYNPASEVSIEDLKKLMSPFLHVHKGNILQKRLPGLKDCVVVLKPAGVQQQLIKIVEGSERSKKILDFERKLSLSSIHPSLFLKCSLSPEEISAVNDECGDLKQLKYNYSEGVKTRFVVEFLRIMQATEEKVLIFSQFLHPLRMIRKQLSSTFTWSEGTEILYMHGNIEKKQRQLLIHTFNDPKSKAKVLLASTKACSEGISLVGASRVVLLDVVWNPSVERQAISRAYRIGQKRLVYTYHLIIKDTTEWDKYMKQAEKERMAERVFSDKSKDGNTQVKVSSQDYILDELCEHSKLTGMFDKVIYHPKQATHLIETVVPNVVYF